MLETVVFRLIPKPDVGGMPAEGWIGAEGCRSLYERQAV